MCFFIKMEVLKNEAKLHKEKQLLLEKKNLDEAKAIKMRQDFLSIMSHEIRTPLNAITSIVELLKDEVNPEGKELFGTPQLIVYDSTGHHGCPYGVTHINL